MVHARSIGETKAVFIVSGKLWRNSLIMQDVETGSLWSHVTGVALHGKHAGRQLATVPSVQTTWSRWLAAHPETQVLKKKVSVSGSRYQSYFDDPKRTGIFRTGLQLKKLPGKEMVHGIRLGDHAVAVPDRILKSETPLRASVGSESILVARDSDGGVRAFRIGADGSRGEQIPVRQAFWFAWLSFFPDSQVLGQE